MADTERPTRLRGAKLLEEGYRHGYDDGYARGLEDAAEQKHLANRREVDIDRGVQRLREKMAGGPKRTRRTKETKVDPLTGETYERGSGRGPAIIPSSSSA